jgi:hypothetical protein
MSILVLQLSDIHIRQKANPVLSRKQSLVNAVRSIVPRPAGCLLLITGDIALTAASDEYDVALQFFSEIIADLKPLFSDGLEVVVIPGNHDCQLPEDEIRMREALITGLAPTLHTKAPDEAIINNLLSAQTNFRSFQSRLLGTSASGTATLSGSQVVSFGDLRIQINSFNTALLSQRREKVGSLSIPQIEVDRMSVNHSEADITISVYHHPDNWLEPNSRRLFRKLIEATSHFVFTGHEHEQDGRGVDPFSGDQLVYVEADALQQEDSPSKSGFNCIVVDPVTETMRRYSFTWKGNAYSAVVDNDTRPIRLAKKNHVSFSNSDRFLSELLEDKFGFTHNRKKTKLLLEDFFVYPTLAPSGARPDVKAGSVRGNDVFEFVRKEKYLLLQGIDLSGKTALLKSLYKDFAEETNLIPVLLTEEDFTASSDEAFFARVWTAIRYQYSADLLEPYKQLPNERRVLLVDNWHKSRLAPAIKRRLLETAKTFFGIIVVTSSDLMEFSDVYSMETNSIVEPPLRNVRIREFSASARGAIIDKWMRISQADDIDEQSLSKEVEKEQSVLDYLIGKKTLPSLPYLILGVLQARQNQKEDLSDPGSFGFLVQKLVLDALSVSKGKRKLIDRKDAILRRCSFEMFKNGITSLSIEEFREITKKYSAEMKISVDGDEILADLLYGRVLEEADGNLNFKSHHFYYYFLAKHFIDEIEGPRAAQIREYLDAMADRPLTKSNQLTLIFFLFFKKRDPVIDRIILQANQTFSEQPLSDMLSDTKFLDSSAPALTPATVNTNVNTSVERQKRLDHQDKVELKAEANDEQICLDLQYDDSLTFPVRSEFALARLDLLGQVIRSFPDSLDGEKKVEILEAAFRLGLRQLHATIRVLDEWLSRGMKSIDENAEWSEDEKKKRRVFFRQLVGFFVRGCCDVRLLDISRAVGVSDLERAYSEANDRVGSMPSTKLIDLAIRLDHSEGFPFRDVQALRKSLPPEGEVALAVLSDLVVRHTQVFKLKPETLRKIAGLIGVKPVALYDKEG